MKFAVLIAVGLLCGAATEAYAQAKAGAPAAPAASAAPDRSCLLVIQTGAQYTNQPFAIFDPALTALPLPAVTDPNAVMVVCLRTTIIPEVTDYRVLTELRLPLSIRAGDKTLFLGVSGGKLQVGVPDGQSTPADTKAIQDRLDEMTAAMAKASPAKK